MRGMQQAAARRRPSRRVSVDDRSSQGSHSPAGASPPRGAVSRSPLTRTAAHRRGSVGHTGLLDWQTDGSLNLVGKFPTTSQVLCIEVVGSTVWTADQDGTIMLRQMNGVPEGEIKKDPQHGRVFSLHWHQMHCNARVCEEHGLPPGRGCQAVWVGYSSGHIRVFGIGPDSSRKPDKYRLLDAHEHAQNASVTHLHGTASNYVCSGSHDGKIVVWDAFNLRFLRDFHHGTRAVKSMCSKRSPAVLFSAGDDGVIKAWDLGTTADQGHGQVVGQHDRKLPINAILTSRQSPELLWSAGDDMAIRVWDVKKTPAKLLKVIRGHTTDPFDVAVKGLLDLGHIVIANDGRGNIQSFAAHYPFNSFKKYRGPSHGARSGNIRSMHATAQHLVNRVWTADANNYISVWFDEVRGEDDRQLSAEEIQQTLAGNYQALLADREQALQAQLDTKEAEAEELRLEAERRELAARELQSDLEEHKRNLELQQGESAERDADMRRLLEQSNSLLKKFEGENRALELQLQQEAEKRRNLEGDLMASVQQAEGMQAQLDEGERQHAELLERVAELQRDGAAQQACLESAEHQRQELEQQRQLLEQQLGERQQELRHLSAAQAAAAEGGAEQLAGELRRAQQQADSDLRAVERRAEEERRVWSEERRALEHELHEARRKAHEAQQAAERELTDARQLQRSVELSGADRAAAEVADLRQQLQEVELERSEAQCELARLTGELKVERAARMRLEESQARPRAEQPALAAAAAGEAAGRRVRELEQELADAERHIAVYEEMVQALKAKLEDCQRDAQEQRRSTADAHAAGGQAAQLQGQVEYLERLNEEKNAVISQQICALEAKCERIRLQEVSCSEVRRLADANMAAFHAEAQRCRELEQQLEALRLQQQARQAAWQQHAPPQLQQRHGDPLRPQSPYAPDPHRGVMHGVAALDRSAPPPEAADLGQRLGEVVLQGQLLAEQLCEAERERDEAQQRADATEAQRAALEVDLRSERLRLAELQQQLAGGALDAGRPDGDAQRAAEEPLPADPAELAAQLQQARGAVQRSEQQIADMRLQVQQLRENRDQFKELSDDQYADILELEQLLQQARAQLAAAQLAAAQQPLPVVGAAPGAAAPPAQMLAEQHPPPAEAQQAVVGHAPPPPTGPGSPPPSGAEAQEAAPHDPTAAAVASRRPSVAASATPGAAPLAQQGEAASAAPSRRSTMVPEVVVGANQAPVAASRRSTLLAAGSEAAGSAAAADLGPPREAAPAAPAPLTAAAADSASADPRGGASAPSRSGTPAQAGSGVVAGEAVAQPAGAGELQGELYELQLALKHKDELNDILKQHNLQLTRELEELVLKNEKLAQDRIHTEHAAATAVIDGESRERSSRIDELVRQQQEERIAELERHLTQLGDAQAGDAAAREQLNCVRSVINELTQRLDVKEAHMHEETLVRIQLERQLKDREAQCAVLERQLAQLQEETAYQLRMQEARFEASAADRDGATADAAALAARLDELQRRHEEVRGEQRRAEEELHAARQGEHDHQYIVSVLKEEAAEERGRCAREEDKWRVERAHLEGLVAQLEAQIRARDEQAREAEGVLRAERGEVERMQLQHEEEVRALRKELNDYKFEALSLMEQMESEKRLRELERQREGLADGRLERDMRTVIDELHQRNDRQAQELSQLRVAKGLLLQQIDALHDEERERKFTRDREVADLNSIIEEKSERERLLVHQQELLQAEVDRLSFELQQKEQERNADRVRFHEREGELMRGHEREMERLQTGAVRKDTELLSHQAELGRLTHAERAQAQQLQHQRMLEEDMQGELGRLKQRYESRVADLEDAVRQRDARIADLLAEAQRREGDLAALDRRCAELDRMAAGRKELNEEEDGILARQRRKLEERDEEINLLSQINRERQIRVRTLEQELEAAKEAGRADGEGAGELRRRLRESEDARDELARQLSAARSEAARAAREREELSDLLEARRGLPAAEAGEAQRLRLRLREVEAELLSKEDQLAEERAAARRRVATPPAPSPLHSVARADPVRLPRQRPSPPPREEVCGGGQSLSEHQRQSQINRELDSELQRALRHSQRMREQILQRSRPRGGERRGIPVDLDGDGRPDAIGYDTTGDGYADAFDTNFDGQPDKVLRSC